MATMAEPVRKRERTRLAKAELWLPLAVKAQEGSDDVGGRTIGVRPMSEWGEDDPMVRICRTYNLTEADLARILGRMADELENRALRQGYEECWDEAESAAGAP